VQGVRLAFPQICPTLATNINYFLSRGLTRARICNWTPNLQANIRNADRYNWRVSTLWCCFGLNLVTKSVLHITLQLGYPASLRASVSWAAFKSQLVKARRGVRHWTPKIESTRTAGNICGIKGLWRTSRVPLAKRCGQIDPPPSTFALRHGKKRGARVGNSMLTFMGQAKAMIDGFCRRTRPQVARRTNSSRPNGYAFSDVGWPFQPPKKPQLLGVAQW